MPLSSPEPSRPLAEAMADLSDSVRQCAVKAGRREQEILTLFVSKTVPVNRMLEAFQAGARDFGENRVQELLQKKKDLAEAGKHAELAAIRWHLIGPLQTNKVRQVAGEVVLIHSLDRPELAVEIVRQARLKKIAQVDCLIQVNTSGEASKHGLRPEKVMDFADALKDPEIRVRGLMTVGPLTEDREKIRSCFHLLRNLQGELQKKYPEKDWNVLSMGMSGDYQIAIEEGSTLIRIGSRVFGARV